MSKRIIVGLDGSEYSKSALELACFRAKFFNGTVIGVAVLDEDGIRKFEAGAPAGAIHYAEKAIEKKLHDAATKIQIFVRDFENRCQKEALKYEVVTGIGTPYECIIEESKTADLIIVGLRTFYHFETSSKPGDTLKQLLEHSICPVIAVPRELTIPKNTVIAYDGSDQASKAMRMFANLSYKLPFAMNAILVNVSDNEKTARTILEKAAKYLAAYDLKAELVWREGRAHKIIYEIAKEKAPASVVMGAFGHNGLTEMFFGSTARTIIEDGTIPVFIYH